MTLTKDQILEAHDLSTESVTVPETFAPATIVTTTA